MNAFSSDIDTVIITVTFGKCHFYSVQSNESFKWDGNVKIDNGQILSIYKLTYSKWDNQRFGPSVEYSHRLPKPEWKSEIVPGSGEGLEGIRLTVSGNKSSIVTIDLLPIKVQFTLVELLEKEFLEFHAGGYYSGKPVSVFLGPDARTRLTRKAYLSSVENKQKAGWLIMPDDFTGKKEYFFTKYCSAINPGEIVKANFSIKNFRFINQEMCDIRLQMMAASKDSAGNLDKINSWAEFEVMVGNQIKKIKYYFSNFRSVQKLLDIYLQVPFKELRQNENVIKIKNLDTELVLLVFRVYINEKFPSHKDNLAKIPPLNKNPNINIGYDLNVLVPQNNEMDRIIDIIGSEEIGNYILFRPEAPHIATKSDYERWLPIMKKYNIKTAFVGTINSIEDSILKINLRNNYLGIHQHECSNLIYGWGDAESIEKRKDRTLPECKDFYLKRMKGINVLGQALPVIHMDYEAGVDFVFCEPPTGHATLLLASSRGAAKAYNRKTWGMHVANHLPINPNDKAMERRNFILINQGWLYGAKVIYDEEAALYAIHDAPHSFSDSLTYNRRKQLQELLHFASNNELGEEIVKIGFLQGLYDCLIGGLQANPYTERTKFWGMIGPEKPSWTFDTPERGWELLSDFMPGVWLYPVLQDPKKIRLIFGASPYGQVDLVPINGTLDNLNKYELLILPGWNTMTDEIYKNLIDYVKNGGHLVLSAAQCTNHITRDFLLEKRDFNFYKNGDLSDLSGIRVGNVKGKINTAKWFDGQSCEIPGLQSLDIKLDGATVLVADENSNPVLVENKIDKGRVWTLTVGEYWGANSLDTLRKQINERLIKIHQQKIFITGEIEDIDYHVYKTSNEVYRIVFLNTDWTKEGNIKHIKLNYNDFSIPLEIREGKLIQVLIKNPVAIIFNTPSTIINDFNIEKGQAVFTIGSVEQTNLEIICPSKIKNIMIDGKKQTSNNSNEKLSIDFGEKWCKKMCKVTF